VSSTETVPLALKYRPTTFDGLVGQRLNSKILQRMVDTGKVPPALLFSGQSGVGKTTAARVLATQLGAADFIEVDAASNGGVDQIRKLMDMARYSTGGSYRILVLDECHSITKYGFEALLKTLEEPPVNTIFVLVTTEPHKIPDTVLSRLVEFQFRAVSDADVLDRVVSVAHSEGIEVDRELLVQLVRRSDGNVRTALNALDRVSRAGVSTLGEYLELVRDFDVCPSLLGACASGDHPKMFEILDTYLSSVGSPHQVSIELTSCLRDILVLRAGGALKVDGDSFEARRNLALALEQERILAAIKVMWEIKTNYRDDDPRGSLEMALVLISEAFTRGRTVPSSPLSPQSVPQPETSVPRKLTLAELQMKGSK